MSMLILVRHGKSEWNEKGLWTGLTDVGLHSDGEQDARNMAKLISDLPVTKIYTSKLKRAIDTAVIISKELGLDLPLNENKALNERDYGIYTGKNKWEIQKEVGEEEFKKIRRSWNYPIPQGETLEDVYNRVIPFYENVIFPDLKQGNNVLISAHGNSLRSLVKYLNKLSIDEVSSLEFGIGEVYIFNIGNDGKVLKYEILGENPNKGKI